MSLVSSSQKDPRKKRVLSLDTFQEPSYGSGKGLSCTRWQWWWGQDMVPGLVSCSLGLAGDGLPRGSFAPPPTPAQSLVQVWPSQAIPPVPGAQVGALLLLSPSCWAGNWQRRRQAGLPGCSWKKKATLEKVARGMCPLEGELSDQWSWPTLALLFSTF